MYNSFHKAIFSLVAVVCFAVPASVGALTITELVNLFVALNIIPAEKQAQALQAVQNLGGSTTQPLPNSATGACPALTRNLSVGMRGTDVADLQRYLQSTGDFTYGSITDYYGSATEAAVKRFQARKGIVSSGTAATTGYGVVGPQTRASLAADCNNTPTTPATPVTTTIGTLGVLATGNRTASISVAISCATLGGAYQLDVGDNSSRRTLGCGNTTLTHTYNSAGNYSIRLYEVTGASTQELARTLVTVIDGSTAASFTVSPTTGNAPLTVTFSANYGGLTAGHYELDFGDGSTPTSVSCNAPADACVSPDTITHTYQSAGTYTAKINFVGLNGTRSTLATLSVSVGQQSTTPTNTGSLFVSPSSGTAPLTVTFSGSVASAGYTLDFGDGTSHSVGCVSGGCPGGSSSTVSVSHTYQFAGTYTAKLRRHFYSTEGQCAGVDCNVVGTATVVVNGTAPILASFFASSMSGNAPLTVTFSGVRGNQISYGDGTSTMVGDGSLSSTMQHTYQSPGSYTVTNDGRSIIVTVTSNTSYGGALSASPMSGNAPLTVTFSSLNSGQLGEATLHYGDGTSETANYCYAPADACITPGINTHTYQSSGIYNVQLILGGSVIGTATITVGSGSNQYKF